MRILFVSLRSDDLGLSSRLLPIAAELRARGHEVAFASPDPAPAKLIAGVGLPNLDCPPMQASSSRVFAEPTPLVRDYDHFLALLGWCDHEFTARQRSATARRSCGLGPGYRGRFLRCRPRVVFRGQPACGRA